MIERMEQFSSRLGELSSRVESTHEHTAHGLEQEARHRDEQLRSILHTHTLVCTLYKMGQDADCPRTRWLNVILCVCACVCVLAMQGHLAQQQKAMAEEKAYLKDIISRMDTQLKEQQRQLEKVIMRNDSNRPRSYTRTCCSSASTKNVIL